MSDSSVAIAQTQSVSQASATRETIQASILRQQVQAERSVATLIEQSVDAQKAALPAGQGQNVDIIA